jgi:chemotaxis signal transduction protein
MKGPTKPPKQPAKPAAPPAAKAVAPPAAKADAQPAAKSAALLSIVAVDPATEAVLRERARRLAERVLDAVDDEIHATVIVTMRGEAQLGFPIDAVREARTVRVTRLPNAPAHIAGLVPIHGQVYALVDPDASRGSTKPIAHGGATPAVIVAPGNGRAVIAVRIDEIVGPRTVFRRELDRHPRERGGSIVGDITLDGLEIIDIERLMALAETGRRGAT